MNAKYFRIRLTFLIKKHNSNYKPTTINKLYENIICNMFMQLEQKSKHSCIEAKVHF